MGVSLKTRESKLRVYMYVYWKQRVRERGGCRENHALPVLLILGVIGRPDAARARGKALPKLRVIIRKDTEFAGCLNEFYRIAATKVSTALAN